MRFKIAAVMTVFFIVFTLGYAQAAWLPKSDVKLQNLKKAVTNIVTQIAARDNYFPASLINAYSDALINALNQNNGQALIIAHDGRKWSKYSVFLNNDEKIEKITTTQYKKDFGEVFEKNKIDKGEWASLIHQFNTLGYAATADGQFKYSYDYGKSSFLITKKTAAVQRKPECVVKIIQDNQEITPRIENKINVYKLKAKEFKIEVSPLSCSPGINMLTQRSQIDYLLRTPLIFTGSYGMAIEFEKADILTYVPGPLNPDTSLDEEIEYMTRDVVWAKQKYKEFVATLGYSPTPAKAYFTLAHFMDPVTNENRGYAEFKRFGESNSMSAAAGQYMYAVIYTKEQTIDITISTGEKRPLFFLKKPHIIVLDFQPDNKGHETFSIIELKFLKFIAQRKGDNATYCLLGNGFLRTISSKEEDSIISEWLRLHPKAQAIPVSIIGEGTKSPIVYFWVVDGSENLNLFLVKRGAFPGQVMIDAVHFEEMTKNTKDRADIEAGYNLYSKLYPGSAEPKEKIMQPRRLISDADYNAFLKELHNAQDSARSQKRGIWSDAFKDLRGE